jgi:hypothetical protein
MVGAPSWRLREGCCGDGVGHVGPRGQECPASGIVLKSPLPPEDSNMHLGHSCSVHATGDKRVLCGLLSRAFWASSTTCQELFGLVQAPSGGI